MPAFAKFHRPHRASLHTGRRIVIRVLTSAMRNVSVITPIIWVPIFRDFKGLGPLAVMGLLQGPPYTANDATPSNLESWHLSHTHKCYTIPHTPVTTQTPTHICRHTTPHKQVVLLRAPPDTANDATRLFSVAGLHMCVCVPWLMVLLRAPGTRIVYLVWHGYTHARVCVP